MKIIKGISMFVFWNGSLSFDEGLIKDITDENVVMKRNNANGTVSELTIPLDSITYAEAS